VRILDFLTHPPFQHLLAKTGHEFTFAPSEIYAGWPQQLRSLPRNAVVADACPNPADFDVIIVATREQYQQVAGRADPRRVIFLSHTILHPWDAEFFAHLPPEVEVVYVSEHKRATFGDLGRRGRTIRLAVDTNEFRDYSGEIASVLNVTNRYAQQGDRDYALFARLTQDLEAQVVGHGNEDIPGAYPARDFEHLQSVYRAHRCFLNTDPQGRMHLSTLEAMATGMPLVTVPIAELAPYLQSGVNCFVSESEEELREALALLLEDENLAREVGERGRQVIEREFGAGLSLQQWNALFEERVAAASRPRRRRAGMASAPPRVAINALSVGGQMTGIGHHVRNLVGALSSAASDQEYCLLTAAEDLVPADRRFSRRTAEPSAPLWEQLELPELLTDCRADLYHNPAFGLPVVKSCRYVATVHDCIPRLFPEYAPSWLRDFFQQWAPLWMRLADHIICVSEHTKHDIVHLYGVDPSRVSVVHQCADDAYRPISDAELTREAAARYGIDRPFVLCVGRVELRKNVVGLLRAFKALRSSYGDDLLLVFAGPRDQDVYDPRGELPPPGRHGNTVVTGYVPNEDLAALYSCCEVLCFPSFYEGFGIPVLEAMQCGAPVVTSRVSSLPEVGGDAALYINPYEPGEIAHALQRVIADTSLRREMSRRGTGRARDFSLERFGAGTAAAYERALAS